MNCFKSKTIDNFKILHLHFTFLVRIRRSSLNKRSFMLYNHSVQSKAATETLVF